MNDQAMSWKAGYMSDLKTLRRRLDQRIGERDNVQSELSKAQERVKRGTRQLTRIRKAQEIVRAVALRTQQQLEYHIGSVVSNAEAAVFDDPYQMEVVFEQRRGKTECDLWFKRDAQYISPLSAGLGTVDVAAFALRAASWSLAQRKTRNVLLLDEAFKHVKGDQANRRAIQMTKAVADELGLQVIMISDERAPREDIVEGADRVIEVGKQDGVSQVNVLEE